MQITPYCRSIFYYETDRMNVVSHTNYIRWMEEARTDFMKKVGIPYDQIEASGIMLPVLDVTCQYRNSMTYGDTFCIVTKITDYNGFKLKIAYEIYNHQTDKLCATATSAHCFTDNRMKPIRIIKSHPEMHALFLRALDAVCIKK